MIHSFSEGTHEVPQQKMQVRSDMEQFEPLIKSYNAESADHGMTSSVADEIINISGANVLIYPRTQNESFDEVWEEDADPTYGSARHMKAYFAPQPVNLQLTPWGIDAPNQTKVVFSRAQVIKEFGARMIRVGDIIEIPFNGVSNAAPDRYRVLNESETGNFKYSWLYWTCNVESITNDDTIDVDNGK